MSTVSDFGDLLDGPPATVHDPACFQLLMEHRKDTLEWRRVNDERLERLEGLIAKNTEMTQQNADAARLIADAMVAGRMVRKLASWAGAVVIGLASVWYGIQMALGHGGPGPGIGPTP